MKSFKLWLIACSLFMIFGVCTSNGATLEERCHGKTPKERFLIYKAAAEQGDAGGQFSLGGCYKNGSGVAQDHVEAVKWFRKSAEQGDAGGQLALGWCYETGKGVAKNFVEAYALYNLHRSNFKDLGYLEELMSPAQIAAGKKRTIELQKSYKSPK